MLAPGVVDQTCVLINKISRDGFTAVYLLQCLAAIGFHSVRLDNAKCKKNVPSVPGQKNCTKFRSHDVRTIVSSSGSSMSTRMGGHRGGCTLATRP